MLRTGRVVNGHRGGIIVKTGLLVVPAIWLGLLMGVSFLATPAKFLAPSLSLAVALDVGRATFAVWNIVEWLALGVFLLFGLLGGAGRFSTSAAILLLLMLLIQTAVLLPALDERIGAIIAGRRPPASWHHLFYIGIDLAKLQVLGVLIWWQGYRLSAAG